MNKSHKSHTVPIFRPCMAGDKNDVSEIAKRMWEGSDYLTLVFDDWVKDGNFYVVELNKCVIGTAKITLFPHKVAWLEGLRVHPDFQKKGIGRFIYENTMEIVNNLKKKGYADHMEFATYYKNIESIKMSEKGGFKRVSTFYAFLCEPSKLKKMSVRTDDYGFDLFSDFGKYIPSGWTYIKNHPDSIDWIKNRVEMYRATEHYFYIEKKRSRFHPLNIDPLEVKKLIPYFSALSKEEFEIMVPIRADTKIKDYFDIGLQYWEKPYRPNVYIYRKKI